MGTPNILINLLKILNITLNKGIDPMDEEIRRLNYEDPDEYALMNCSKYKLAGLLS